MYKKNQPRNHFALPRFTRFQHVIALLMVLLVAGNNQLQSQAIDNKQVAPPPSETLKSNKISGVVTDENGERVIGAAVRIKGTKLGATTNENGEFRFDVNPAQLPQPIRLQVTSIGMKQTDVRFEGKPLEVTLSEDANMLEDVVVTGYQRVDKRHLTSSVTTVKADEILTPGMSTIDIALEGRIPDLVLTNNSGQVGATARARVRGTSTILGNREPLWVVDGFIVTDPVNISSEQLNDPDFVNLLGNAIAGVNPQDIDQIDVLKDASATALYGTRAANGVIVITTKRGKEGPIRVSYDHTSKFMTRPAYTDNHTNLMNSYERVQFGKHLTDIHYVFPWKTAIAGYEGAYMRYMNGITDYNQFTAEVRTAETANTDWLKLLTQNSYSPSHNIQMQGGSRTLRYFTSLAYTNDNGVAKKEFSDRYSLRANLNASLNSKLRLNINISGNVQKRNHAANGISLLDYAFNTSRAIPATNPDGTPYFFLHRAYSPVLGNQRFNYNIINELENSYNKSSGSGIGANMGLVYSPVTYLELSASGSYNRNNSQQEHWWGEKSHYVSILRNAEYDQVPPKGEKGESYLPYGGILNTNFTNNESFTGRLQADFRKFVDKGNSHLLNLMMGVETFSNRYYGISDETRGFMRERGLQYVQDIDLEDYPLYKNWLNKKHRNITNGISNQLSGYFTASYSLKQHFIFNINGRIDYSNKFGDRSMERFLPIWTTSARWNLEENLLKGIKPISEFQLKISYGTQGNMLDSESPNMVIRQGAIDPYYNENTSVIARFPNPNLLWERTHQVNTALDMSFFDRRLSVQGEYWYKLTQNAFNLVSVVSTNGVQNYQMNEGEVENKGYNVRVSATPFRSKDFTWSIYTQTSKAVNRILSRSAKQYDRNDYLNGTAIINGQPVSTFFSYKYLGLNPANGVPMFDDYQDRRHLLLHKTLAETVFMTMENSGTRDPLITGSLSNSLRYKQYSVAINVNYSFGAKMRLFPLYAPIRDGVKAETNVRKEFLDRWMKPGDEKFTDVPVIMGQGHPDYYTYLSHFSLGTDEFVANFADNVWAMYDLSNLRVVPADYVRLSSLSFRYRFDDKLLKKTPFKDLEASINGMNLYTIANKALKGQDPMQAGFAVPQMGVRPTYTFQFRVGF